MKKKVVIARFAGDTRRQVGKERLRRFAQSDLTVAACRQIERVSVPVFDQWRKKLERTNEAASTRAGKSQAFVPLHITPMTSVEMRLPKGGQAVAAGGLRDDAGDGHSRFGIPTVVEHGGQSMLRGRET